MVSRTILRMADVDTTHMVIMMNEIGLTIATAINSNGPVPNIISQDPIELRVRDAICLSDRPIRSLP
jgi:hypothetical protein